MKTFKPTMSSVMALFLTCSTMTAHANQSQCNDSIGRLMVSEALLTAQLIASMEAAGQTPVQINAVPKDLASKSVIEEFWITDPSGDAYLTNTGVQFKFDPDPAKQPQASAFWPLLTGEKQSVIQDASPREHDGRMFKYVGVAGIDKRRIVQVGISAERLPKCD